MDEMFNFVNHIMLSMTLSFNCKDGGDPVCTHTMHGETEEELLQNVKKHESKSTDIQKKLGMKRLQRMLIISASS